jgi:hypothetical protein
MQKDSEMGKEWDSNSLPFIFYSRLAKMEKVLSHILLAPDFFPKSFHDELQLNPRPYNFLRLFMALRSSSVPELGDRIIKRPGPMKNSQTLAQYAFVNCSKLPSSVKSKFSSPFLSESTNFSILTPVLPMIMQSSTYARTVSTLFKNMHLSLCDWDSSCLF